MLELDCSPAQIHPTPLLSHSHCLLSGAVSAAADDHQPRLGVPPSDAPGEHLPSGTGGPGRPTDRLGREGLRDVRYTFLLSRSSFPSLSQATKMGQQGLLPKTSQGT